jgi:hypothetical protein
MEHGDDNNALWLNPIVYGVRESTHERASHVLPHNRMDARRGANPLQDTPHRIDKPVAQPVTPLAAPIGRLVELSARFR